MEKPPFTESEHIHLLIYILDSNRVHKVHIPLSVFIFNYGYEQASSAQLGSQWIVSEKQWSKRCCMYIK